MSDRIRAHLRSNVVGYIALFCFAMSGSAMALDGTNTVFSDDIVNGEVSAADIGTGELTSGDILNGTIDQQDLANGAVGGANLITGSVSSPKVANGSLTNLDIANTNSLAPAEIGELGAAELATGSVRSDEIADQTVTGDDLAGTGIGDNGFNGDQEIIDGTINGFDIGDDQINGDHIADGSLTAGDTSRVFEAGYGSNAACTDNDEDGEICAGTTLTLTEPGKLLVNATGEWHSSASGGDGVQMDCVLQVDDADIGGPQSIGEAGANHPNPQNGTMALTALSGVLSPGVHNVQTFCTQVNANIDLDFNQITAARIDD